MTKTGTNRLCARLSVGAANTLTSLNVKMQSSPDNTNWTDITDAAFTTVTAGGVDPQIIPFQLPVAATAGASPATYVRAVAVVVGTSVLGSVAILGTRKFDEAVVIQNTPPTIN